MMIERDEDSLAREPTINAMLLPLIEHIFAVTADGSHERKAAMSVVLELPARIRAALVRRSIN
jgi:hypothetical protein